MFDNPIESQRIGFVGLGTMGLPMAKQLVEHGFDVTGFDLREGPLDEFADAGGSAADSLADVGQACDIVSVMVKTDEQVTSVVSGEDGLFEGMEDEGGIVLVHSTVHPKTCETLAEVAPNGVVLLDAPVSGVRLRAQSGELTMMVGGSEEVTSHCEPLFLAMGNDVFHMGAVGSGEVTKLANNLVAISNMMTTAEGLRLGTEWGIDQDELVSVMLQSSAESFVLDKWEFLTEEWEESQPGGLEGIATICRKDLSIALDLAGDLAADLPGAAVASQSVPAFYRGLE